MRRGRACWGRKVGVGVEWVGGVVLAEAGRERCGSASVVSNGAMRS